MFFYIVSGIIGEGFACDGVGIAIRPIIAEALKLGTFAYCHLKGQLEADPFWASRITNTMWASGERYRRRIRR